MNKEEVAKLAKANGAVVWNSPFNYIIKDGTISFNPIELLAFASACEKIGIEKAAKICDESTQVGGRLHNAIKKALENLKGERNV